MGSLLLLMKKDTILLITGRCGKPNCRSVVNATMRKQSGNKFIMVLAMEIK